MYAECLIVLFSALLLLLVFGAFIQERSPWRYCPACKLFWHQKRNERTRRMPAECDGLAKAQVCPHCEGNRKLSRAAD